MDPLFAVAFTVGPLIVRWYGIIVSSAFALGMFLAYRETLRQHQSPDHLMNILLLLLPSVIVGARLYYVIFRWDMYADDPIKIFATWEGGLAIHGGVIAGVLVVWMYCRAKKLDPLRWTDILCPSLILGQAIGRWGNFANAEAYGGVIAEGSFWSWVPLKVMVDGVAHHPTFLYESVWNLLVFVALMILIRRPHRIGYIFCCYLIFYSIGRFFIESMRMDSLMIGPFRTAMVVSALGVLLGALLLNAIRKRPVADVSQPPEPMREKGKKDKKRQK